MSYQLDAHLHAVRTLATPDILELVRPLLYDPSPHTETLSAVLYSTTIALAIESGEHEEVEYMLRSYLDEYERKYADTQSVSDRVDLLLSMRRLLTHTIRLLPALGAIVQLVIEEEYPQHLGVRPRALDVDP